ncbi:MAG: hypothetical protein RL684_1935, partial [Pseudomonadota bacterium]
ALNSLRGVVFDLVPLSTEELGFEFSVKRFATELAERAGMRCRVHFPAEPIQAPQSTLETLFMVAQEALTNAVRHSRAGSVDVFVEALIDSVRLRVVDNGVGMTSQDRERPGHLGLLAAAEQLTPLGGTLRLTSMVGHGTTLEATVPVRRDPSLPAAEGYWL